MKKLITSLLLAVFSFGAITTTYADPIKIHLKKGRTSHRSHKSNKRKAGSKKHGGGGVSAGGKR